MDESMHNELMEQLRFGRLVAVLEYPYFARIIMAMRFVLNESFQGLAAVDKFGRCYFNPNQLKDFLDQSSDRFRMNNLAFLILHEASHIVREHHVRAEQLLGDQSRATHHRWNVAADLEENADLLNDRIRCPDSFTPLHPRDYDLPTDLLAEEYYGLLTDTILDSIPFADQGSAVFSGDPRDWELQEEPTQTNEGGITEFEIALARHNVGREITEHQRKTGNVPAGILRLADLIQKRSRIDWKAKLLQLVSNRVTEVGRNGQRFSYRRVSRRGFCSAPILMPRRSGQNQFALSIVVDTSGSMTSEMLGKAVVEIAAIATSCDSDSIEIIPCDCTCYKPIQLRVGTNSAITTALKDNLRGCGGTDLRKGCLAAVGADNEWTQRYCPDRRKPDMCIILTDGETPFPDRRMDVPIIFAIIGESIGEPPKPWKHSDFVLIPNTTRDRY